MTARFASPPTIETARLYLRPMWADDADAMLGVFGDPQVMAYFGEGPFNREQMVRWIDRNLGHQERYGYGLFAVLLRDSGTVIGDCGLEHMDIDGTPVVELGYDLRRDQWGQGMATEAATAVRDFAFHVFGLPQLVSLVRASNTASARVATKVGMHSVRTLTRGTTDYTLYAVSRDEMSREGVSAAP